MKECLTNASETPLADKNVLKQLKDTLSEKLEALKLLDNEIVEILSNSEAEDAEQQLEKEIQETDDTRAELQKIILDANDALFEALPSLPQGQSTPSQGRIQDFSYVSQNFFLHIQGGGEFDIQGGGDIKY